MSELNDPRVLFAAERTLLAWNRTSLALIAFGFLIEKSDVFISINPSPEAISSNGVMTFLVGLGFIAVGIFAVYFSSRQYKAVINSLKPAEFPAGYSPRFGLVINVLVGFLGAVLAITLYLGRA
jgi:putative membrane protein